MESDGLKMKRCCEGVGLPCLFKVSVILICFDLSVSSQGQGAEVKYLSCTSLDTHEMCTETSWGQSADAAGFNTERLGLSGFTHCQQRGFTLFLETGRPQL